jgi:DNA-directed RNA polymerase II subunit RPB1
MSLGIRTNPLSGQTIGKTNQTIGLTSRIGTSTRNIPRNIGRTSIETPKFINAISSTKPNIEAVGNTAQVITTKDKEKQSSLTMSIEDSMPSLQIVKTQLTFMTYEKMKELSKVDIDQATFTGRNSTGDPRLGCQNDNELCSTCRKTIMDCPGHYGLIHFPKWIINPMVPKAVVQCLECICNSCGSLLIDDEIARKEGLYAYKDLTRLKKCAEICVKLKCPKQLKIGEVKQTDEQRWIDPKECKEDSYEGAKICRISKHKNCLMNPKFKSGDAKSDFAVKISLNKDKDKDKEFNNVLTVEDIYDILSKVTYSDANIMGFTDPDGPPSALIMKGMLVIPPPARPTVHQGGEVRHDQLTHSYHDVIKVCEEIKENATDIINGKDKEIERIRLYHNLYFYVSHIMNNTDKSYGKGRNNKEPVKSVKQRIGDKSGIIRGSTMGKRGNYCARTVLGPNSKLKFGYVSYPKRMRKVLTTPEVLTVRNRDRLMKLYDMGEVAHLTAMYGKLKGRRFKIDDTTRKEYRDVIQIGDIFDRWGQTGDEVIFNRQPTLYKYAFMVYKSIFTDDETIGLHSSSTTPHNADYDGDEGALSKLQSLYARAEGRIIANVESNIMSNHANRPILGLVFNCPASVYIMSKFNVMLDKDSWNEALTYLTNDEETMKRIASLPERLEKHGVREFSGNALFSLLLPENFYYNNGDVEIRDGILRKGVLKKKHVGPSACSIIHYLHKKYGQVITSRFLTEGQFICDWFLEWWGLSIGYADCITSDETKNKIKDVVRDGLIKAELEIEALGEITPEMSQLEKDYREKKIEGILNNISTIGRKIGLDALSDMNPLNIMCDSGAKGSEVNIAQICGLIAQQFVKGKRPALTITNGTRCLPYFDVGDTSLKARGFIEKSFMDGMDPEDMVFHLIASRMGLIDTAVKTADVGHLHHRLNKVLEDVVCAYDNSIRNVGGTIFKFSLEDSFNCAELIPTNSIATGDIINFIDLKNVIGELNLRCGYDSNSSQENYYPIKTNEPISPSSVVEIPKVQKSEYVRKVGIRTSSNFLPKFTVPSYTPIRTV